MEGEDIMASTILTLVQSDIKEMMKSHQQDKLTALRTLLSDIKNATVNAGREPNDDDVTAAIARAIKQRRDSVEQYRTAGREDLAQKELMEIDLFIRYQPQQLDAAELEILIREVIRETNATSRKDMGRVMQALMPKTKGKADGKVVNQLVQSLLP